MGRNQDCPSGVLASWWLRQDPQSELENLQRSQQLQRQLEEGRQCLQFFEWSESSHSYPQERYWGVPDHQCRWVHQLGRGCVPSKMGRRTFTAPRIVSCTRLVLGCRWPQVVVYLSICIGRTSCHDCRQVAGIHSLTVRLSSADCHILCHCESRPKGLSDHFGSETLASTQVRSCPVWLSISGLVVTLPDCSVVRYKGFQSIRFLWRSSRRLRARLFLIEDCLVRMLLSWVTPIWVYCSTAGSLLADQAVDRWGHSCWARSLRPCVVKPYLLTEINYKLDI